MAVDRLEPRQHARLLVGAEWVEDVFGHKCQREADWSHLDHALVEPLSGIADRAPVLGVVRIGSMNETLAEEVPMGEWCATRREGHDAPQRTRERFKLGSGRVVGGGGGAQRDARSARRIGRNELLE